MGFSVPQPVAGWWSQQSRVQEAGVAVHSALNGPDVGQLPGSARALSTKLHPRPEEVP